MTTSIAVAPYRLTDSETRSIDAALGEGMCDYSRVSYALGLRQGLIIVLAGIIERAAAAHPLRMTDEMQADLTTALSLAMVREPEQVRAWLAGHHVPVTMLAGAENLEYAAAAGAARSCLLSLAHVIGVMTRG